MLLVAVPIAILSGCMASQDLRKEDRAAIRKIYIAPQVSLPARPMIITRGMGWGAALGGALGAVVSSLGETSEGQLVAYLAQHDILIDQIARKSFAAEVAARSIFEVVDAQGDADATVKLDVVVYGVG